MQPYNGGMLLFQINPGPAEASKAKQATEELVLDLKMMAPDADIAERRPAGIAESRESPTTVTTLIATGINLGVFAGLFQVAKAWAANRPKAEVTIVYPNGSTLKVSNGRLEQALNLLDEQQKTTVI